MSSNELTASINVSSISGKPSGDEDEAEVATLPDSKALSCCDGICNALIEDDRLVSAVWRCDNDRAIVADSCCNE